MACSLALSGCSLGGDEQPKPAAGTVKAVGEAIERLERAMARGDWRAVCNDLFTPAARERAGGDTCPRLLRSDAAGLRDPSIRVLRIDVQRRRATVRVRSRARGQPPLTDLIELRRVGGRYRVEALAR